MSPALLGSAWVMGLLGSTHCAVMCGGVVATICSTLDLRKRESPVRQAPFVLAYNAGRIASYAAAGAIAGSVGAAIGSLGAIESTRLVLRLAAGVVMLLVGAYVSGFAGALRWVERAGAPLWNQVRPWALRLVPLRTWPAAFGLGLLWGWMPCGLVYAALAAAVTSGSASAGAATMAAFGLGTLPMLLAMGSAAAVVARAARIAWVRRAAGAVLVAFAALHLSGTERAWANARAGAPHTCCAGHHPLPHGSEAGR
jgi:uncharacterized protein